MNRVEKGVIDVYGRLGLFRKGTRVDVLCPHSLDTDGSRNYCSHHCALWGEEGARVTLCNEREIQIVKDERKEGTGEVKE